MSWGDFVLASLLDAVIFIGVGLVLLASVFTAVEVSGRCWQRWRKRRQHRLTERQKEAVKRLRGHYSKAFVIAELYQAEQNIRQLRLAQEKDEQP